MNSDNHLKGLNNGYNNTLISESLFVLCLWMAEEGSENAMKVFYKPILSTH